MGPGTRRARAAERTRAEILGVARLLFRRRGFEAVTLREVALAAGRTTGAVTANFPDKPALYREAVGVEPDAPLQFLRELAASDGFDVGFAIRQQARALLERIEGPAPAARESA